MRRIKYSTTLVAEVVRWLPGHSDKELAAHLAELTGEPFDAKRAKNWRVSRKIPQGRRQTKEELYRSRCKLDPALLDDVRAWTPGHNDHELAAYLTDKLHRPFSRSQAKGFRLNHKIPLGKPIEGGGRFVKGQASWCKGLKLGRRSKDTEFKKGNIPHNTLPIGTRRKAFFNNGTYRWKTKIADPDRWEFDHRLIWEKAHGSIPEDHVVLILDQDPDHLELDNLACISKTILSDLNKNSIKSNDREVNLTRIELSKLRREIYQKRKEMKS